METKRQYLWIPFVLGISLIIALSTYGAVSAYDDFTLGYTQKRAAYNVMLIDARNTLAFSEQGDVKAEQTKLARK